MKKILIILGPNLNMVGVREKGIYGEETASDIEKQIISYAESNGFSAEVDRKSTRLNSSHRHTSRMPSSA